MSLNIVTETNGSKGLEPVAGNGIGRAKFGSPINDYLVGHTTAATAIIADRDGILFHQITSATTSGVTVKVVINEKQFWGSSNTYAPGGRSAITLPIRKGDIIYGDIKGSTVSMFYPFQEVQVTNLEAENKYSTDEIIVGEWIDGRPIYRRVLSKVVTSSTSFTYTETISNFDRLIRCDLLSIGNKNVNQEVSTYINVRASISNNVATFIAAPTTAYEMSGTQYLIVEYTKTTD